MNWKDTLKLAFQNVRTNLLRSVLTLTIIAVGLMALVGILTAIDGIIYSMGDNFSKMGTNSFTIKPTGHGMHGRRRGRKVKQGEDINLLLGLVAGIYPASQAAKLDPIESLRHE